METNEVLYVVCIMWIAGLLVGFTIGVFHAVHRMKTHKSHAGDYCRYDCIKKGYVRLLTLDECKERFLAIAFDGERVFLVYLGNQYFGPPGIYLKKGNALVPQFPIPKEDKQPSDVPTPA